MRDRLPGDHVFPEKGDHSGYAGGIERDVGQSKNHQDFVRQVEWLLGGRSYILNACLQSALLFSRLVEVFHVDTGVTEYAEISSVCAGTPPMLRDIPQQALQCSLSGVEMVCSPVGDYFE